MKSLPTQLMLVNRGSRALTLWAHLSLIAGFGAILFLFILGKAGTNYFNENVLGAVPDQEMKVGVKKKDMAFFRVAEQGDRIVMGEKDLTAMAAITGVREIWPLSYGSEPSAVEIHFFGNIFRSGMVIQGIDPAWIADDVDPAKLEWKEGDIVPVVANSQLLIIYNNGYAASQGYPQLSANAVMAPIWTLIYGDSRDATPVVLKARVVGFSPKVALGTVIPHKVLDYLHRQLQYKSAPVTEVVLELEPSVDSDRVRREIDSLGFAINEPHPLARIFRQLHSMGVWSGLLLIGCVGLFGFAYLNQTLKMLFLLKKRDYAICRAMGMSRRRLRILLLTEALAFISFDLAGGLTAGFACASLINQHFLTDYLVNLVGMPLILHIPWTWIGILCFLVLLTSLCFLLPRILSATSRPVGDLLSRT